MPAIPPVPTTRLGSAIVSRLIVGGNCFSGFSHASAAMDKAMRDYYTVAKIKETLAQCERAGVNTFFGRADNHVLRIMNEYWNEGGKIQFFAQTAPERPDTSGVIAQVAEYGAAGCYLHGGETDDLHDANNADRLRKLIDEIKARGMVAGVAGHNPRTHLWAQDQNVPIDFHMLCFYNISGRRGKQTASDEFEKFDDRDRQAALAVRKQLTRPCVAYKVLAAGRNDPEAGFRYAFENLRPADAINVGMYTAEKPAMIQENARLVAKILADLGQA